jgi:hypothetical protein
MRLRHLTPEEFDLLGEFCAALLAGGDPWIFRRKESVTFLDEATIGRQQSVDFTVDAIEALSESREVCKRVFGEDVCAAPLFILDKDPASALAFDLKDESGRSLSLMTSEENGEISAATLRVLCRKKLEEKGLELSDTLAEKLTQLAESDASGGRDWLERLKHPLPDDPDRDEIDVLLERPGEDGEMSWWLNTLALASIVLVTFESGPNHRRVIKISYEQPTLKQRPRFFSRVGWRSFQVKVRSSLIRSGRYHLEVKAPPEFRLTQVALVEDRTRRRIRAPGFRRRAQLYLDDAHEPRGALSQFALRVSGRGVLGGALLAAFLVLAAIVACMAFAKSIAEGSTGGPALLLVLPGAIATYVARSDQHGLTTRMLAIPRWVLLLLAGVAAYYAAGTITLIGPAESSLKGAEYAAAVKEHTALIREWLRYGAAAAAVAVIVIGIGWFFTRELPHSLRRWSRRRWRRYTASRFDIQVTLGIPADDAWPLIEGELVKLRQARRFRNASTAVIPDREYILHRDKGIVRAIHGVSVSPAPGGTTMSWIFWANAAPARPPSLGPLRVLLRPLIDLFVLWERLATRRRIARLGLT